MGIFSNKEWTIYNRILKLFHSTSKLILKKRKKRNLKYNNKKAYEKKQIFMINIMHVIIRVVISWKN